jgi:hypothetical protein
MTTLPTEILLFNLLIPRSIIKKSLCAHVLYISKQNSARSILPSDLYLAKNFFQFYSIKCYSNDDFIIHTHIPNTVCNMLLEPSAITLLLRHTQTHIYTHKYKGTLYRTYLPRYAIIRKVAGSRSDDVNNSLSIFHQTSGRNLSIVLLSH